MKAGHFTAVLLCRGGYQPPVSLPPQKPSPWGEGGWPKARRMRGRWGNSLFPGVGRDDLGAPYCREFRRLRTAGYFARGGKVTKTPPGDAAEANFVRQW